MVPKKIPEKWVCSRCGHEYDSQKDASQCEVEHQCTIVDGIRDEVTDRFIKRRNKKDYRWEKHCVDCGKVVLKWDTYYDGHRNEAGDKIVDEGERFFRRYRCDDCLDKFETKLVWGLMALNWMTKHKKEELKEMKKEAAPKRSCSKK